MNSSGQHDGRSKLGHPGSSGEPKKPTATITPMNAGNNERSKGDPGKPGSKQHTPKKDPNPHQVS